METIKLKSLGMEGDGQEPSSVEEFDSLAKKQGVCLQRAREYVRFHVTLGLIRELFLHGQKGEAATAEKPAVEEVIGVEDSTGIARKTKPVLKDGKPVIKDNEPVTDYDETEGKYFDRVIATLVEEKKFATEDEARASFQPLFDQVIKIVGFPAEASERKASGPKKLAAKYKTQAAMVIARGTVDAVNTNQLAKINKTFTVTSPIPDGAKMFEGTGVRVLERDANGTPTKTEDVPFKVLDADAEKLGWLIKEYLDWKADQERNEM